MKTILLFGMIVCGSLAVPTFAHHGFAVEFDKTKCMDLRGTLTSLDWENPHAYIHMDVKDASGKTVVGSNRLTT